MNAPNSIPGAHRGWIVEYLDTADRQPSSTLGRWLESNVGVNAVGFYVQAGFFECDVLGLIESELTRLATDGDVVMIVGSNQGATTQASAEDLATVLALPGPAELRFVKFSSGLYHPKTYVVVRDDGSKSAYVGSANFTADGASKHIEAGIALDTRSGDAVNHLDEIIAATRAWLPKTPADGVHRVASISDVPPLVASNVLGVPQPRPVTTTTPGTTGGSGGGAAGSSLSRLLAIPSRRQRGFTGAAGATGSAPGASPSTPATGTVATPATPAILPTPASGHAVPIVRHAGYPPTVLFDPAALGGATAGTDALSGAPFPSPCMVVRLNRIATKKFRNELGTSDVNLSIDVLPYLRFGIYGANDLPRADFDYRARYVHDGGIVPDGSGQTNITYRGVGPTATATHPDLRLLVPGDVRMLGQDVAAAGLPLPDAGSYLVLHLPTAAEPTIRYSFIEPSAASTIHAAVGAHFRSEIAAGHGLGANDSAVWAPDTLVPPWP